MHAEISTRYPSLPCIYRVTLHTRFSALSANPRDEIHETQSGYRCCVLKLKTVASLGKDYAILVNTELPRTHHARLTPLLISHFSRITQHPAVINDFRTQIDFPPRSLPLYTYM